MKKEEKDVRQFLKRRRVESDLNFQTVKLRRGSKIEATSNQVNQILIPSLAEIFRAVSQG
jgi:hypothetical protein